LRQLLRACRSGDDRAARSLYTQLGPALLVLARSILRDEIGAEDAVQAAFCKLMTRPKSEIRAVEYPHAWLATVVRNECLMKLRSDKRAADRARTRAEATLPPDDPDADRFDLSAIQAAVDALPDHLREIVVLKHASGLTFDQIAEVTQQNRNTAASRYRDALQKLKAALAGREYSHTPAPTHSTAPSDGGPHYA
jgi:RNA polymerase sigma-70 factor, ECF subfamily